MEFKIFYDSSHGWLLKHATTNANKFLVKETIFNYKNYKEKINKKESLLITKLNDKFQKINKNNADFIEKFEHYCITKKTKFKKKKQTEQNTKNILNTILSLMIGEGITHKKSKTHFKKDIKIDFTNLPKNFWKDVDNQNKMWITSKVTFNKLIKKQFENDIELIDKKVEKKIKKECKKEESSNKESKYYYERCILEKTKIFRKELYNEDMICCKYLNCKCTQNPIIYNGNLKLIADAITQDGIPIEIKKYTSHNFTHALGQIECYIRVCDKQKGIIWCYCPEKNKDKYINELKSFKKLLNKNGDEEIEVYLAKEYNYGEEIDKDNIKIYYNFTLFR